MERETQSVRRVGLGPVQRESPGDGRSQAGTAEPLAWFGAEAVGGLMLPSATPTASQLYAPRGVWLDDRRLIVADTGNHRILVWNDPLQGGSHRDADLVLGQSDFVSEGAQSAGQGPENGMRLPTGLLVHEERLIVADAWNHRLLIWNRFPEHSAARPDLVIGQSDLSGVEENRGQPCGPLGFNWPFGIALVDGWFYVTDTGNRRVLVWPGIPEPEDAPEVILGQPTPESREENRGRVAADSFRWPHDVAGDHRSLFIADAGNHRILGWDPRPERDREADRVLGQPDFDSVREFPYAPQTAAGVRFPYAIALEGDRMAAADTANNRILVWDRMPETSSVAADRVLGQPDFAANGENRWDAVALDTFCWPYGIRMHNGHLAVADSGNNRAMIWTLGR